MISRLDLEVIAKDLATRAGQTPVYDTRVDTEDLALADDPALEHHVRHQILLRAYQSRYMLLPSEPVSGSIIDALNQHYDPPAIGKLDAVRPALETELIGPSLENASRAARGVDYSVYVPALVSELRNATADPFLKYLSQSPFSSEHYKNFLIQSSADLLAEASASAFGIVGEFGAPQSALFRVLIDEFGYGVHDKKHSVLYRETLRGFGLCQEYNAYWPLFDTVTLSLHNTIHYLFQNPRNFFLQVGFLLFAETSYQRSTTQHHRYLRQFHPQIDARYFGEHAHIDLHHTAMILDEVAAPLIAKFGVEVGGEIIKGAELTRSIFAASGAQMLAVSQAFDLAVERGKASYGLPPHGGAIGRCVTPTLVGKVAGGRVQVGGLGVLEQARDFDTFPVGSIGRLLDEKGQ